MIILKTKKLDEFVETEYIKKTDLKKVLDKLFKEADVDGRRKVFELYDDDVVYLYLKFKLGFPEFMR